MEELMVELTGYADDMVRSLKLISLVLMAAVAALICIAHRLHPGTAAEAAEEGEKTVRADRKRTKSFVTELTCGVGKTYEIDLDPATSVLLSASTPLRRAVVVDCDDEWVLVRDASHDGKRADSGEEGAVLIALRIDQITGLKEITTGLKEIAMQGKDVQE